MNSKFISLCLLLVATTSVAQSLTYEDIMKGFTTNIQGEARAEWFDSLYVCRNTLTNAALKTKVETKMIEVLQSEQSDNQDKCAAAHIVGLFSLKEGINALINNFVLWNEKTGPDAIKLREGKYPVQGALVDIGEPALPYVIEYIEKNDPDQRESGARTVLFIMGQKDGSEFLKQAIVDQTDANKKENLKAALASEYFTDPKYQASGPQKQKLILAAQVTLKPETLNVNPGILTAFVRLPAEYPVSGITSATCDYATAERMMLSTAGGSAYGGNEDATEMIIKFRRQDIEAALAQIGESLDTNFVVRGIWRGAAGTNLFQGADSITKIVGAKSK